MIKGLTSNSKHISIMGGSTATPYINNYNGQSMVGQLRFNPQNSNIEVYDGNMWQILQTPHVSVGLNMTAEEAIDWAIRKKQEELELDNLCTQHPALAEAYERLQIIKALVKQSESNTEKG